MLSGAVGSANVMRTACATCERWVRMLDVPECAWASAVFLFVSLPGSCGTDLQHLVRHSAFVPPCICWQQGMTAEGELPFTEGLQTVAAELMRPVMGHAHANEGITSEKTASNATIANCGRRHLAIISLRLMFIPTRGTFTLRRRSMQGAAFLSFPKRSRHRLLNTTSRLAPMSAKTAIHSVACPSTARMKRRLLVR